MEKLQLTLEKKLAQLNALAEVIAEEQLLLCAGRIQGMALQDVTEKKSTMLTTLAWLDKNRINEESTLGLKAPYEEVPVLAECWQKIQAKLSPLHNMNKHNGMLLSYHIDYNNQALAILNASHSATLYGANGQTCKITPPRRKMDV